MVDLFGVKARETANSHLMKIKDLESEINRLNSIINIQAKKIDQLDFRLRLVSYDKDIDFPNS